MNKKLRLILCVLFILIIGIVTIWRSFEMGDEGEQNDAGKAESLKAIQDACQDYVISIRCEHGGGNAVLLCEKEDSYILCTAAHVVQGLSGLDAEDIQIEIADAQTSVSKLWISDTYDVAFIEIEKEDAGKDSIADASTAAGLLDKKVTGLSEEGFMNLKEEDLLWIWSYYGGELVSTEIKVSSPWILVEDFGYHMIWASTTDAKGGMSGSGVFDCEGHLAGILCGGNDTEVAVLPVNIILGELKNSSIDISLD